MKRIILGLVLAGGLIGCQSDQVTKKKLEDGKLAIEQNQFDAAIAAADSVVRSDANHGDVAAGYYLRGRAIEQRVKADPQASGSDLTLARADYNRALQLGPGKKLEGYVRSSLANVNYFQDDYANAYGQWQAAYDLLDEPDLKAWALYRIGLSQQRMGRFDQADKTFDKVQARFPDSEQAKRAADRKGANEFVVQLATFNNPKSADALIADLKAQGVTSIRNIDARGLTTIRVGPVKTYVEAEALKARFADKYADAIILP